MVCKILKGGGGELSADFITFHHICCLLCISNLLPMLIFHSSKCKQGTSTDLNNTGSRTSDLKVKPKKMTNLEYQNSGRLVLQDVSASYEQYQKEIIATKA